MRAATVAAVRFGPIGPLTAPRLLGMRCYIPDGVEVRVDVELSFPDGPGARPVAHDGWHDPPGDGGVVKASLDLDELAAVHLCRQCWFEGNLVGSPPELLWNLRVLQVLLEMCRRPGVADHPGEHGARFLRAGIAVDYISGTWGSNPALREAAAACAGVRGLLRQPHFGFAARTCAAATVAPEVYGAAFARGDLWMTEKLDRDRALVELSRLAFFNGGVVDLDAFGVRWGNPAPVAGRPGARDAARDEVAVRAAELVEAAAASPGRVLMAGPLPLHRDYEGLLDVVLAGWASPFVYDGIWWAAALPLWAAVPAELWRIDVVAGPVTVPAAPTRDELARWLAEARAVHDPPGAVEPRSGSGLTYAMAAR